MNKIDNIFKDLDKEILTRPEFFQEFSKVVKAVAKFKENYEKQIEKDKAEIEKIFTILKGETLNDIAISKSDYIDKIEKKLSGVKDGYSPKKNIDYFDGTDGIDGLDADDKEIVKKILEKLPNELKETKAMKLKKRIKELEKRIKDIEKSGNMGAVQSGGFNYGSLDIHIVDDETPSGTVNGTNKEFTITHIPSPATSLKVYVNGQRTKLTDDYTFSGQTVTFVTAPPTNSIILCDYRI